MSDVLAQAGEFFSQGGYARFVWGAYGMVALLLVIEILQLRAHHGTVIARLARLARMHDSGDSE